MAQNLTQPNPIVKLLMISGVGVVIANVESQTVDALIVRDAAQFYQDPTTNEYVMTGYMDELSGDNEVVFFKSSVVSMVSPNEQILNLYKSVITPQVDAPKIITPPQGIIVR